MTQAAGPASGEGEIDFAVIRQRAVDQARPIDIVLKSKGFELMPDRALDYIQALADEARGQGTISEDEHKEVTDGTTRIKAILGAVSRDRLLEQVERLIARKREELGKRLPDDR